MVTDAAESEAMELSVAGSLCIDPGLTGRIAAVLSPEDFTLDGCRELFTLAVESDAAHKPFDAAIAAHALARSMGDGPARDFVRRCMVETPTTANAEYYAKALHEAATLKAFHASMLETLMGPPVQSGKDLAAGIMQQCRDFLEREHTTGAKSLRQALGGVYNGLDGEKGIRVDTGFPRLDALLMGVWSGNLCVIGARPKVGKSAMALAIAENAAMSGGTVLIYSMEMQAEEIAERAIVRHTSGVEMDNMINGSLTDDQYAEVIGVCTKLSKLPILINDSPYITVSKIRAEAANTDNLKLIIVDFVSLMQGEPGRRYDSRNLELGAISRGLKNLAAELKIPVIALAQLNREKGDTVKPSMKELRDSGELEQNANKIVLMWFTDKENKEVGVCVDGNRRGGNGSVKFRFDGAHMRFYEIDYIHDEPGGTARYGGKPVY